MTVGWTKSTAVLVVISGLLGCEPSTAWSHAADEMAPPPGSVVIAPRVTARAGQTEIVTIFYHDIFALFLTEYATDVPVPGATVEASTDLQSAKLTETDPGVYSTRELLMSPGRNDVTIKITLGGVAHTLSMPLMMPAEEPTPAPHSAAITSARSLTIAGTVAAVCALSSLAFLVSRRRPARLIARRVATQTRQA